MIGAGIVHQEIEIQAEISSQQPRFVEILRDQFLRHRRNHEGSSSKSPTSCLNRSHAYSTTRWVVSIVMASPPRVNAAGWLHQPQGAIFGSSSATRSATTTIGQFLNRTAQLFHNRCNVFDNTIDLLLGCVKYRHSRMTSINSSNERLFKRVDRKSLRKISERRRLGIRALTGETDRVATRTVLRHERPSARDTIVRTRRITNADGERYCQTE